MGTSIGLHVPLNCSCCGSKRMPIHFEEDVVVIKRRGPQNTYHERRLNLNTIVSILDPKGTSFTAVKGTA